MGGIDEAFCFLENLFKTPEKLYNASDELSADLRKTLKTLYDHCKEEEINLCINSSKSNTLPKLLIENFDDEQIWQQIELQNEFIRNDVFSEPDLIEEKDVLDLCKVKNYFHQTDGEESCSDRSDIFEESEHTSEDDKLSEMEIEQDSDHDNDEDKSEVLHNSNKKSVDVNFFKLHEMNEFLDAEEKKMNPDSGFQQESMDSDEESIDLFDEFSEDSEDEKARLVKYEDFFSSKEEKKPKKNKYLEEFSDEDVLNNEPSNFELRQNRVKRKIDEIESNAISEKPWQLQGEVKGDSRPQNSLLEEAVEFERTSRPAPIITEKTTLQLEDIIKQRIKDKAFDSVVRKVKVVDTPQEYRKKLVLDQEKSKASLAQIYEKEYLDQQAALDPLNAEKEEEVPELHKKINNLLYGDLFPELDSYSNHYLTPKPAIPEMKIVSNIPAINMEEVAPVAISDAALLAPEEVKRKPKVEILGKNERTITDKNRERRKKKLKQKYHASLKGKAGKDVQEVQPAKKYSKQKDQNRLEKVTKKMNTVEMDKTGQKGIKSSTAFFKQLQDQIHSQIQSKSSSSKKKNTYDAKKMKL